MNKIIICIFSSVLFLSAAQAEDAAFTARSVAIVRTRDGAILYGKKPFLKIAPASTAKVMTVLIALEEMNLDKEVAISGRAADVEPTRAGLIKGTRYAMRDLIKAALISSANDASVAIAEGIAGSEESFVIMMNKKAEELGMKNTLFVNASGLPDKKDAYTTTYDLTILMREASKNILFTKIAKIKYAVITGSDGGKIWLRNHNKLLWRAPDVIGKTGYTNTARHCFVGADTAGGNSITFAVLASRSLWRDVEEILKLSRHLEK